jgi:hypothetical protein
MKERRAAPDETKYAEKLTKPNGPAHILKAIAMNASPRYGALEVARKKDVLLFLTSCAALESSRKDIVRTRTASRRSSLTVPAS